MGFGSCLVNWVHHVYIFNFIYVHLAHDKKVLSGMISSKAVFFLLIISFVCMNCNINSDKPVAH